MLQLDVLPGSVRMYARDSAAISHWDGKEIHWFDDNELSVGTEIDTDAFYAIFNAQLDNNYDRPFYLKRQYHDEIIVQGFLGSSDCHICSLFWRGWTLRATHVHPKEPRRPINEGHTYLWAPNTEAGRLTLVELKLILG